TTFGSITVTGGGYTITGNAVALSGGIDDSTATGNNTIKLNITLSADQTFTAPNNAADTLILSGTIANGGFLLTLAGAGGSLKLTRSISGTGGLTDNSAGTTTLSGGGNTYKGTTTVQSGTLVLQKSSGNAIPAALVIGPGSATVQLAASN